MRNNLFVLIAFSALVLISSISFAAVPSALTVQGRLEQNGVPATGSFDVV